MRNVILVMCLYLAACGVKPDLKKDDKSRVNASIPIATSLPNTDTNNLDNNTRTGSFLLAAWVGLLGDWPNVSLPTVLIELTFNIVNKSASSAPINILSTSNAAGFAFDGKNYLIDLDRASSLTVPTLASRTQHVYISSYLKSFDGTKAIVQISYNADDPTTTGLGLRIHYDNNVLQLSDVNNILEAGLFIRPEATSGVTSP